MSVLVTGGAGYIGAHVVRALRDRGKEVVVVDDMSSGVAERIFGVPLLEVDLASADAVGRMTELMRDADVDSVVHLAARKQVPESVARPAWYYAQNIGGFAHLLMAMEAADVRDIVFSSSAAVYGDVEEDTVRETDPVVPVNPYGATKLAGEELVNDAAAAGGLRAVSLRYFNVAGAGDKDLGDIFALNLIPMIFEKMVANEPPMIFGDDYPTPDGTCVRDFIHVADLARAHVDVLDRISQAEYGSRDVFNVGSGRGYSVREVMDSIGRTTGHELSPVVLPRRAGDPPKVVADTSKFSQALGWQAERGLDEMTASAWGAYCIEQQIMLRTEESGD